MDREQGFGRVRARGAGGPGGGAQMRGMSGARQPRHSYFHQPPHVSPARIRRQVAMAMIALAGVTVLLLGWGLVHLLQWAGQALGSGIAPHVSGTSPGAAMMLMPLA